MPDTQIMQRKKTTKTKKKSVAAEVVADSEEVNIKHP